MPVTQTVSCDAPNCGKDITKGNGRMWRMQAYSQVIQMDPASTPRGDAGDMVPLLHFCDNRCLANWSTASANAADTAQAEYVTAQAAKAAAAAVPLPGATEAQPKS